MSAEALVAWAAIIDREMKAVRNNLEGPEPSPAVAAYHCQQAAEKIVKAVLVAEGLTFRKTHDIDALVELLPADHPLRADLRALDRFTPYAIAYRYPMDEPIAEPSVEDVSGWRAMIDTIRTKALAFIAGKTERK